MVLRRTRPRRSRRARFVDDAEDRRGGEEGFADENETRLHHGAQRGTERTAASRADGAQRRRTFVRLRRDVLAFLLDLGHFTSLCFSEARDEQSPHSGADRKYGFLKLSVYTLGVHKTTLVVDDQKLARARKILGTKGIKETIDRALDEVVALASRRRALGRLKSLEGLDLEDPEIMDEAWR